ncbi:MAG TPA: hypothetical protein VK612_13570 [Pyrinomonadaceae bacterium]|nr:hypothetical protein [Pyrinomonadaceae bacterium]
MDLINDLGSDLAMAFLVERTYGRKLDSREAIVLIDRVKTELEKVFEMDTQRTDSSAANFANPSH